VETDSANAVRCFYGRAAVSGHAQFFHIPAQYHEAPGNRVSAFTKHRYADQDFPLSFGIDAVSSRPDWLGELFVWLSCGYEAPIVARDRIGRIPYSETVFSRHGLSARKPYASLLMAWMENVLRHGNGPEALPKAPCPLSDSEHLVVCSHDIDFYFTNRASTLIRLIKNLGIAVRVYRNWSYFVDNLRMIRQALGAKRVGSYLPPFVEAAASHNFHSTLFVVSRRGHRRDPNYRLDQIVPSLRDASKKGFSIGLHGSYRSIVEDGTLQQEAHSLAESLGQKPASNRQHWLRFSRCDELFAEVSKAGLLADSTLGFPDMVGFRNGASFAFPPYDFEREAPHSFLEIPLALMDGSLEAASRDLGVPPDRLAAEVLEESRKYGWGGIAVLWHNPIEPISVPAEINDVFWRCVAKQAEFREKWMSLDEFLSASIHRYQQAGLLQEVRIADMN
jgi:hypothetical protein